MYSGDEYYSDDITTECDTTWNPRDGRTVLREARANHGFLKQSDVEILATDTDTRLTPCLVRCGGCRFTCPAQDVAHLIGIIARDGQDYVRDVSLPATER